MSGRFDFNILNACTLPNYSECIHMIIRSRATDSQLFMYVTCVQRSTYLYNLTDNEFGLYNLSRTWPRRRSLCLLFILHFLTPSLILRLSSAGAPLCRCSTYQIPSFFGQGYLKRIGCRPPFNKASYLCPSS